MVRARRTPLRSGLTTHFVRRGQLITAAGRRRALWAIDQLIARMAETRARDPASLLELRRLWQFCGRSYADYDVEALDPCIAAADARPLGWNESHPATVVPSISVLGVLAESG